MPVGVQGFLPGNKLGKYSRKGSEHPDPGKPIEFPVWDAKTGKRSLRYRDVEWVYHNLGSEWRKACEKAPSPGAAWLLKWAQAVGRDGSEKAKRLEMFYQLWGRGIPAKVESEKGDADFAQADGVVSILDHLELAESYGSVVGGAVAPNCGGSAGAEAPVASSDADQGGLGGS